MQNSLVISAFDSLQSLIIDCGALMSIKSFEVSNNPNLAFIKLGDGIINKNICPIEENSCIIEEMQRL